MLVDVALPNLTRDEAAERAALVTVDAYRIVLDLTDGDGAPSADAPSGRRRPSSSTHSPGRTPSSTSPPTSIHSATLNGVDARRLRLRRIDRHRADRAGRAQRARRRRRLPLLEHRRGPAPLRRPRRRRGLPVLAVRDRRRQADVRLLRPARPQGDLRRQRHRARALAGDLQRRARRRAVDGRRAHASRPRRG